MKTLFTFVSIAIFAGLLSFSDPLKNSSGALPEHTGSPGDNKNCTACHPSPAVPISDVFSSDIPLNGYVPGETYTINVTTSGSGRKGFQVSPQNVTGDLLGTLAAGSGNKLVGNNKYVTHSSGVTTPTAEWSFSWIAPETGTGNVVFYGAFVTGQPNVSLSTMEVEEDESIGIQDVAKESFKIYPLNCDNQLKLVYHLHGSSAVKMLLFDLSGRLIMDQHLGYHASGNYNKTITVRSLEKNNVYIAVMTMENQIYSKKVLF
jgi:hypothetical protein